MRTPTERLLVVMEDPLIHTGEQSVCRDPGCPCHLDVAEAWQGGQATPWPTKQHAGALAHQIEEGPL